MGVIALTGIAQHEALRFTVEKVERTESVYLPFLTARLVGDGPGRSYLAAHCPSAAIPTCALWEALSHSDDPRRFTASHVTFERSARLGSFRRMSQAQQREVG